VSSYQVLLLGEMLISTSSPLLPVSLDLKFNWRHMTQSNRRATRIFTPFLWRKLSRRRHNILFLPIALPLNLLILTYFKLVPVARLKGSIAFKGSRAKKPIIDGDRDVWLQSNEVGIISAAERKAKLWSFWTLGSLELEW